MTARLFSWVGEDDYVYDDFDGMYVGQLFDDAGELEDQEAADLQAEHAAFEPCPLEAGQKVARRTMRGTSARSSR